MANSPSVLIIWSTLLSSVELCKSWLWEFSNEFSNGTFLYIVQYINRSIQLVILWSPNFYQTIYLFLVVWTNTIQAILKIWYNITGSNRVVGGQAKNEGKAWVGNCCMGVPSEVPLKISVAKLLAQNQHEYIHQSRFLKQWIC